MEYAATCGLRISRSLPPPATSASHGACPLCVAAALLAARPPYLASGDHKTCHQQPASPWSQVHGAAPGLPPVPHVAPPTPPCRSPHRPGHRHHAPGSSPTGIAPSPSAPSGIAPPHDDVTPSSPRDSITAPSSSSGIAPQPAASGIAPPTTSTSRRRPPHRMEFTAVTASGLEALIPIVGVESLSSNS